MKLITVRNNSVMLVLILAISSVISCSDSTPLMTTRAYVIFHTGVVTIRKHGAEPEPVWLGEQVDDSDIIRTGEKSCVIIQNTEELTIRLEQNSEAVISSLNNALKKEVGLNKGKVLSSVSKLKKGSEYYVKTPTTVASVRGTEFLTTFDGRDATVAVGSGKVSVKRISGNGDWKTAVKGFTAVAPGKSSTVKLRKLNKIEKLELSKIRNTPSVENIEKKTPGELKEIFRNTEKADKKINDEISEIIGLTPAEMRARFGRIDTLYLYNGSILKGVIASRGNVYKILTQSGIVMVDSKDIKTTETTK